MAKKGFHTIIILLLFIGAPLTMVSAAMPQNETDQQSSAIDIQLLRELEARLQLFIDDISTLQTETSTGNTDSLVAYERRYKLIEAKWNTYYQAQQMDIAADDGLMELAANYETLSQTVSENINNIKEFAQGEIDFIKAESLINKEKATYTKMFKQAMTLTMAAKLAPKLEKLKAQEQLIMADIEEQYTKARTFAENNPDHAKRMKVLENNYLEIKSRSEKIQTAVYKPFIQRVKDKLLIAAAMAIILMFVSMVTTKLKAIKNAREMAKKFKSQFQNNQDYPTI